MHLKQKFILLLLYPPLSDVVLCDTIDTTIGIDIKFGIAKESIGIASIGYILLARLSLLKKRVTL